MKSILQFASFKNLILLFAVSGLTSCAVPDPMFLANSQNIQNTDYSKNKIVGTWARIRIRMVQDNNDEIEDKGYLDLRPGGTGTVRQATINRANGGYISLEAPLKWQYLEKNWWEIALPPSTSYKVTESHHMMVTPGSYTAACTTRVRYYDGNLYDIKAQRVMVPATRENVARLANRMRAATPVYHINSGNQ
jgi:hypothetical protein